MRPSSSTTPRRWKVFALQFVVLAAVFALGRYWSLRSADGAVVLSAEKEAANHGANHGAVSQTSSLTPTAKLAQAKAELAKILRLSGKYDRERALLALAAGLDVKTLQGLLAGLKPEVTGNNTQAISILLGQWAESDPQAALGSLKDIHDAFYFGLATSIFDAWSAKDPAAALAAIAQLPEGVVRTRDVRGDALKTVIENMMAQDPQSALSALLSPHIEEYSTGEAEYLFGELASVNPSATAAAALNLPPSSLRNGALSNIASAWAAQDPASALAWANGLPAGQEKAQALNSAIETMSEQDPTAAAAYALQLPSNSNRDSLLGEIAESWAQTDPTGLLAWAGQNLTGTAYANTVQQALYSIGQNDPAAEVAALAQISDPNIVNTAIRGLARSWAEQDVQAALAWAQALPADNAATRNTAMSSILSVWTDTDPANAAAYIQTLINDPSFGSFADMVINSLGASDPQAALAWAQSLPPGAAQNSAFETALGQLANVDPQTAIEDAGQLSGGTKGRARVNIFDAWSAQQPAEAAAALANMTSVISSPTTLNTVTADVARNWLNQDPNAATQWINTLPPGPPRDNAVEQVISTVGQTDPASAFTWALSIGGQNTRNTQVVNLATQWSNQNPTAAAAAAQNALNTLTGLTDAQTTALQTVVNKAPAP